MVLQNGGRIPTKEDLAEWVYKRLRKAATPKNIQSGFRAIAIFPLQCIAVDSQLGPSKAFQATNQGDTVGEDEPSSSNTFTTCEDINEGNDNPSDRQRTPKRQYATTQNLVGERSSTMVDSDDKIGTDEEIQHTCMQYYVQLEDAEQSISPNERVLPFE